MKKLLTTLFFFTELLDFIGFRNKKLRKIISHQKSEDDFTLDTLLNLDLIDSSELQERLQGSLPIVLFINPKQMQDSNLCYNIGSTNDFLQINNIPIHLN